MTARLTRSLRLEVEVDAPMGAVFALVADVTRTGEWSHECRHVEWVDGATSPVLGARFRGGNRSFVWRWTRTNELIELERDHLVAWRTIPTWRFVDSTVWRITVDAIPAGTRIVQTYDVVKCPRWWEWLVAHAVPPHRDRREALLADLHRIGAVAAADVAASGTSDVPGR